MVSLNALATLDKTVPATIARLTGSSYLFRTPPRYIWCRLTLKRHHEKMVPDTFAPPFPRPTTLHMVSLNAQTTP